MNAEICSGLLIKNLKTEAFKKSTKELHLSGNNGFSI